VKYKVKVANGQKTSADSNTHCFIFHIQPSRFVHVLYFLPVDI
jgi:hypothetical protein